MIMMTSSWYYGPWNICANPFRVEVILGNILCHHCEFVAVMTSLKMADEILLNLAALRGYPYPSTHSPFSMDFDILQEHRNKFTENSKFRLGRPQTILKEDVTTIENIVTELFTLKSRIIGVMSDEPLCPSVHWQLDCSSHMFAVTLWYVITIHALTSTVV